MECAQCGVVLPEGGTYCESCGTPVTRHEIPLADGDSHRLLTEANLARLRGQLDDAINSCTCVLRLEPDNAAAHSLLGDIYREQGNYREALGWYKLAVRLNPESAGDQKKLDEMIDRVFQGAMHGEQHAKHGAHPAPLPQPGAGAAVPRWRQSLTGVVARLRPIHLVIGFPILFIGIVLLIYAVSMRGTSSGTTTKPRSETPIVNNAAPPAGSATITPPVPKISSPEPDVVEIGPNPNRLGIVTRPRDENTATPPSANTRPAPPDTGANTGQQVTPFRPEISQGPMTADDVTKQTEQLRTALQQAIKESKWPQATLNDVVIDPRTRVATIGFTTPALTDVQVLKKVLLYTGFVLVWGARTANPGLRSFVLRGSAPSTPEASPSLAWSADITPEQANNASRATDYRTVQQYQTNPWWRSDLADVNL